MFYFQQAYATSNVEKVLQIEEYDWKNFGLTKDKERRHGKYVFKQRYFIFHF